ncbi:hypothetical protein, partial [Francisella tularensis]|uniref:hypothetical protein n=1 Tax=Francisella tularensis TaxID=263 RepID=UPI001CC295F7
FVEVFILYVICVFRYTMMSIEYIHKIVGIVSGVYATGSSIVALVSSRTIAKALLLTALLV